MLSVGDAFAKVAGMLSIEGLCDRLGKRNVLGVLHNHRSPGDGLQDNPGGANRQAQYERQNCVPDTCRHARTLLTSLGRVNHVRGHSNSMTLLADGWHVSTHVSALIWSAPFSSKMLRIIIQMEAVWKPYEIYRTVLHEHPELVDITIETQRCYENKSSDAIS